MLRRMLGTEEPITIPPGAAASHRQPSVASTGENSPAEFRDLVRRLWTEFHALPPLGSYLNTEGGDVRQVGHPLSSLRHCANYAAALKLLRGRGKSLRLLEIGCGSGALSGALARTMPEDWSMVATDYSAVLVESARHLYARPNLEFDLADANGIEQRGHEVAGRKCAS